MRRRRSSELKVNHERWLVSYADFITLLFAFFVVMYSISQVNEGKYRVLSETLDKAFKSQPQSALPIQTGVPARVSDPGVIDSASAFNSGNLPDLEQEFRESFESLLDSDLMYISSNELWLQVELRDEILFDSGSAQVSERAQQIFTSVADILRDTPNPIQIEGFTDNLPIRTSQFPSNWELSAARASAIVKWMAAQGVAPTRLAAVGYGEYQPVASNDTPEGRAQNRRVAVMIARDQQARPLRSLQNLPESEAQAMAREVEVSPEVLPPAADTEDSNGIEAVEMDNGNLLFSSDPELPRNGQ
ncbi:flagellar motor protein MotD [Gilvimarinus xylanilyticus]|uniref:Flagellar motor protein MotD n=1 Tax=Gilvimarinus xylanilyticus TaxID=2944139 RepID=A0A9X2KRZ9_9GAMM|nr:flagellar motor protein MotD [Gilvimarinus xylanilyticus]